MKPKSGYVFSVYNLHTKKRKDIFVEKKVLDMFTEPNESIGVIVSDLMDKTNEDSEGES